MATSITIMDNTDKHELQTSIEEVRAIAESVEDGYTPVRGIDYWTEEDKAEIEADNIDFMSTELAKRGQLKPEFAQTIEECTDTSKLYVLPDGYIYAYMYTEMLEDGSTNLAIPDTANTTDTSKWVNNYKIGNSGMSAQSGKTVCNPIQRKDGTPLQIGDVIRIKGTDFASNNDRFMLSGINTSGSAFNQRGYVSTLPNTVLDYTYNAETEVHMFTVLYENLASDGVFRIAFTTPTNPEDIIITVNEEIEEPKVVQTLAWANTGNAFVPADYEDRIINIEDEIDAITDNYNSLNIQKNMRRNLIDVSKITKGGWASTVTGDIEMYPDNANAQYYTFTDYIPVIAGANYTFSNHITTDKRSVLSIVYYDEGKNFVSSDSSMGSNEPNTTFTITIPIGVSYLILNGSYWLGTINPQLEKGNEATEYEEYLSDEASGFYMPSLKIKASQIQDLDDLVPEEEEEIEYNILHLPEKYNLVVGDTFELFYKGVMLCKNPYNYNILVNCSIGKPWSRKFEATPTAAGNYTLTITISDDNGKVLDTQSTILAVAEKATTPAENVNILCIGDSITQSGLWCNEVHRRLTNTNSVTTYGADAPTGDGLGNINFIGKKKLGDAGYEASGGWKYSNYLNTTSSVSAYWVSATHNKTDSDQESVYQDVNGAQWQLETIEVGRLKFKKYSGEGTLASSGVLTWVSGGTNTEDINYHSMKPEAGNPFVYNGAIDFAAYCNDIGVDTIDKVFILLGWNSAGALDVLKADAKTFLGKLITFNPAIKITLVGVQIPSLDGCANNYGATGIWANYHKLQEFVFELDKINLELSNEYPNNVDSINLSGQFDTEYSCITDDMSVNSRCKETIKIQTNGLHPNSNGYYQIADAVYRKIHADY